MGNRAANKVAGGIADVTIKISETLIHHLGPKHTGEKLQDPNARPNAAKEIAAAAVLAATGVYDSMEQASRLVLKSSSQATGEFVGHKCAASFAASWNKLSSAMAIKASFRGTVNLAP